MKSTEFFSSLRYLLWDLDGTLYPPISSLAKKIHTYTIETVATHLQLPYSEAEKIYVSKRDQLKSNTDTLNSFGLNGLTVLDTFWKTIDWNQYIQPNPELVEAFLHSPLPHAILTNSNSFEQIEKKLTAIGLPLQTFTHIVTSTETGFNKPDARAFEAALSLMKVPPETVLYIGDRVDVDIIGAQAVGFYTCLIGNTSPEADISAHQALDVFRLLNAEKNR